jgi:hypothetical protein
MDKTTVYTKTAKGITQVNQKSASLSKDLMKVLKLIDGKSNFGQILEKADMDQATLTKAFTALQTGGFARVFATQKKEDDPFADDAGGSGGGDDFDFTAPGKMPAATQRVVAGAANDISELVRQQEKADAARKANAQAQDAARARATQEAQQRAKLEAEAKAKAEAERQAMEQAQRAKEAAERAKAELESKMREEAARKASAAAQAATLTAQQKAKEEEEQRKLAELRVKAEKEAKALAEARARAEAEAAALAKARAEAEAAAKKQAAEASNAEAQLKQKLKEEIEQRIRGEMEELMRTEGAEKEEKGREEMRAQIMEEAKLAAKAELEERLQAERDAIHKVELEARSKAEAEANAKAAQEAKLRAEAEARAVAATAAALKAEEEAKRAVAQAQAVKAQAEAEARRIREETELETRRIREESEREARALREAQARAKAEADAAGAKIEAERRAKFEAEARMKIEQEEAEKRRKELEATIETERKAKAEAEARARIEAKARETVAADTRAAVQAELEADMGKRAEIEGKAKAKAYMEEKAKAEQEEEEKMRADQARRAKEMAEILRSKVGSSDEGDADDDAPKRKKRRSSGGGKNLLRTALVGLGLLFVGAVALVHVVPMRSLAAKVEVALGKWLHDDVSISSAKFWLFPTPHLKVENVAVGKLLDAKAATGKIYLDPLTIFGDKLSINSIEFEGVQISGEAVRRMPTWGNPEGKDEIGAVSNISLKNVRLEVKPALEAFNADLSFDRKGAFTRARLVAPSWSLGLKPGEGAVDVDLDLRNYKLPAPIPVQITGATLKGKWSGNTIVVPEFDGTTMDGKVSGTLKVTWGPGVRIESELALARVSAKDLVATFTKDIAITGRLDGNFQVVAEGPSAETLFHAPRASGKFRISDGSVSNIDLVAVMQSDAAGSRAGVTKFAELTGEYSGAENRNAYRNVALQGGVLRGNGSFEIGQSGALAGRAVLEIRSQVAQDRGSFNVTGTVSRPIIRRGG